MEVLDLHAYLLAIHRQQGRELIDDDLGGQSIVCSCAVNLLTLPLDPTDFFMKRLRPIPESVTGCRTLSVELGVVPPRGDIIFSFILGHSRVILLTSMSLSRHLVGIILSLGWCPPRGDIILSFILRCSRVILLTLMSLSSHLVSLTG
jgi:hypothetical protein